MTTTPRDAAYRSQPSLFDQSPPVVAAYPQPLTPQRGEGSQVGNEPDQGIASRDETYAKVVDTHEHHRSIWLDRVRIAGSRGITLDELSALYHTPAHQISGRITELTRQGKVVRTTERRPTRAWTPERKITAAVIVAIEHHHPTTAQPTMPTTKDIMPDQDTTTGTPRDQHGDPIRTGCTYLVSIAGRAADRFYVCEEDCQQFLQPVFSSGKPITSRQSVRIGSINNSARWELVGSNNV